MGGTGKTPVVAALAAWLVDAASGRRFSAAATRARMRSTASWSCRTARAIRATVEQSGDEPLMLARQVPGAIVCVSPDRHLAGALAEQQLGCTVHVLDDGFQHLELARDLDILVTTIGEIPNGRVLPVGRLREPMDAAARAHCWSCRMRRRGRRAPRHGRLESRSRAARLRKLGDAGAGIAGSGGLEPDSVRAGRRFSRLPASPIPSGSSTSLKDAGWNVVDTMTFADHHRYTAKDVAAIAAKMQSAGADAVFTTDKDAVRFEALAAAVCRCIACR